MKKFQKHSAIVKANHEIKLSQVRYICPSLRAALEDDERDVGSRRSDAKQYT